MSEDSDELGETEDAEAQGLVVIAREVVQEEEAIEIDEGETDADDGGANEDIPNEMTATWRHLGKLMFVVHVHEMPEAEFEADRHVQKYMEVNEATFEEVVQVHRVHGPRQVPFPQAIMQEAQDAWNFFINQLNGRTSDARVAVAAIYFFEATRLAKQSTRPCLMPRRASRASSRPPGMV